MIPLLYEADEREFGFPCIYRLFDTIHCTVTEIRNGEYECEFIYPLNGKNYSEITLGRHIGCRHDANGDIQPFTIYRKEENTDGTTTFYAHHITYELNRAVVMPFTENGISAIMARFNGNSGINNWRGCRHKNWYQFSTDITSMATYTLSVPVQFRSFLGGMSGSILDSYGGEYEWDKYNVILHSARGSDKGAVVRYGGNLVNAENADDDSDVYGGVVPYWKPSDGSAVQVYYTYYKDNSDEKYYPYRIIPLDVTSNFHDQPTQAQVDAFAQDYLNQNTTWVPYNNIVVDFVPWTDEEIANESIRLQNVCLCDTVTVDIPQLNMKISTKVIKTVWNVLLDRYDSIELGKSRTSLAEMLSSSIGSGSVSGSSGGGSSIVNIVMNADYTLTFSMSNGTSYTVGPIRGEPGEAGPGVVSGGTEGQLLAKASDDDYDTEWTDSLPLLTVGNLTVTNDASVSGDLGVSGDADVTGDLTVGGTARFASEDISDDYTFTKTSGNANVTRIRASRFGSVVNIELRAALTASTSAGSNVILGTLSGGALPSIGISTAAAFSGSAVAVLSITPNGEITVRAIAASYGANGSNVYWRFMFLTND